jgi:hypothetical protein
MSQGVLLTRCKNLELHVDPNLRTDIALQVGYRTVVLRGHHVHVTPHKSEILICMEDLKTSERFDAEVNSVEYCDSVEVLNAMEVLARVHNPHGEAS